MLLLSWWGPLVLSFRNFNYTSSSVASSQGAERLLPSTYRQMRTRTEIPALAIELSFYTRFVLCTVIVLDALPGHLRSKFSFPFTPRLKAYIFRRHPTIHKGQLLIFGNSALSGSVSHEKYL